MLAGLTKPFLFGIWFFSVSPILFLNKVVEVEIFDFPGGGVFSLIIVRDWTGIRFRCLIRLISFIVFVFGDYYIIEDKYYTRFFWILFLFVISINLLIFFPCLPIVLIGWDGLGVRSFALIIYYRNNKSLTAGVHTLIINRLGDVLIILGIFRVIFFGHWNLFGFWIRGHISWWGCLLIVLGAITKRAQVPFSSWLPAAIAAPTPVSALVHSSTLVTAGIYLIIRFYSYLSSFWWFYDLLMFLGVFTSLLGGWCACYENDLKKIVALSTLRQLGVIVFSLSLGYPNLTLFHLYTHALFKSILFICAGHIIHSVYGSQDIRHIRITYNSLPFTLVCFNFSNLALIGFPFISGYYSKDAILETRMTSPQNTFLLFFISVSTFITVRYTFRLFKISVWRAVKVKTIDLSFIWQVSISTLVLSVCSLVGGSLLFSGDTLESVIIPNLYKLFIPLILLFGMSMRRKNYWKDTIGYFLSDIWFFPSLVMYFRTTFVSKSFNLLNKILEKGWLEPLNDRRARYFMKINIQDFFSRSFFIRIGLLLGLISYL